jgi:hypothetical protein
MVVTIKIISFGVGCCVIGRWVLAFESTLLLSPSQLIGAAGSSQILKHNYKHAGRELFSCLLVICDSFDFHVCLLVCLKFNFNLFLFIRSEKELWPTGYRTCQFHLTLSIYITIRFNTYKQPKIKNIRQSP